MDAVIALPPASGATAATCAALGLSRASVHRRRTRLTRPPAEVYATLLDEAVYHCSIRTMYRILDDHAEVRERRDQLRHPVYSKPELLAEGSDQVWSWDITKLMGPVKWSYFYPRHLQPPGCRLVRRGRRKHGPVQGPVR